MENAKEEMKKPFAYELELRENEKRLEKINRGLNAGKDSIFEEVLEEVKKNDNEKSINIKRDDDPVAKIKQLKEMLDIGAITQEDFEAKKKEILDRM